MFKDELGEAVGITAELHVSTNTKPYFCRVRPVPHALKSKDRTRASMLTRSESNQTSADVRMGGTDSAGVKT